MIKVLRYLFSYFLVGLLSLNATQFNEVQEADKQLVLSTQTHWGLTGAQLEAVFQKSQDMVCLSEFGGKFIRLNQKWHDILGWDLQEFCETPSIHFIHPKDVRKTLTYEKNFIPTGFVNRFRAKNGVYHWLSWIGLPPIQDANGKAHVFSIVRDVTIEKILQKQSDKKIKALNERLGVKSDLLESLIELQWSYIGKIGDTAHRPHFSEILKHFIKISHSEFGFIAEVDQQAVSNRAWGVSEYVSADIRGYFEQSHAKIEQLVSPLFHSSIKNVLETSKPISFTALEEKKLFNNTDDFPCMRSFLGIPLLINNETVGVIALANRPAGYSNQLLEWLKPLFVLSAHMMDEVKLSKWPKRARRERTKRLKAEAELSKIAHQRTEIASTLKSNFIAHMSHELRTPLTAIIGHLDLIDTVSLSVETLEHIYEARAATQLLTYIARDILDLSIIEAKAFKLDHKDFDLWKVAQEAVQVLKSSADTKKLDLKLEIDPRVPTWFVGDADRLRQVMYNLIKNAIKFTNQGSVQVRLEAGQASASQKQLRVESPESEEMAIRGMSVFLLRGRVTDTGIGIDPNFMPRLFQPFSQADATWHRQFGGTGLGLHLTQQICEKMGGTITVNSNSTTGSTFVFQVPLEISPQSQAHRKLYPKPLLSLPPLHILVAEDNLVTQKILSQILTKEGCTVSLVPDGQQAVEATQCIAFDLVLMDGEMPVMDGLEATRRIRQAYGIKALPIIAVTAHALPEQRDRFMAVQINGYLTKPFKADGLKAEILRCLQE